jgi:hypothetical protein
MKPARQLGNAFILNSDKWFGLASNLCHKARMNDIKTNKNPSALVQSVVQLDQHFSDLIRLGARIDEMDLKSNFDYEQADRLIAHFAETGQEVSNKIRVMSAALNDARSQAETAAERVAARAEQLQARKNEIQMKMDQFRLLGEKVARLTESLSDLKQPGEDLTSEQGQAVLTSRLANFELLLHPLIEEAKTLKEVAQSSKIKALEQSADSMRQSLIAVSQKLSSLHSATH